MPLYEYKCLKCGRTTEKIESVNGPHLRKCPHCGGKVESVISAPAIQFKGSGWYVTDYAGKSADGSREGKGADGKETPAGEAAAAESTNKEAASKDGAGKSAASKEKDASSKKPTKKK